MCSSEVGRAWNGNLPNQYYPSQYIMDSYSSMPQTWSDYATSSSAPAQHLLMPGPVPLSLEQELIHSHDLTLQGIPAMQDSANDYSHHYEAFNSFTDDTHAQIEAPPEEKNSTDRELEAAMRSAVAKFLEDPGCEDSDESDEDMFAAIAEVTKRSHEQESCEFGSASTVQAQHQSRSLSMPPQMPAGFALAMNSQTSPTQEFDKSATSNSQMPEDIVAEGVAQTQAARTHLHDTVPYANVPAVDFQDQGPSGSSLVTCLRELLLNGSIPHDIRLVVEDGDISAHHFILMERSSFFKNRLQGGYVLQPWEPLPEFRISGVSLAVIRHILLYIYTDTCDVNLDAIAASSCILSSVRLCLDIYSVAADIGLTGLKNFLINDVIAPIVHDFPSFIAERVSQLMSTPMPLSAEAPDMNRMEMPAYPQNNNAAFASDASQGLDPAMLDHLSRIVQEEDHARSQQMDTANDQVAEASSQDMAPIPNSSADFDEGEAENGKQAVVNDGRRYKLASNIRSSGATTLMIRNLPRTLKQKKFIQEINSCGFGGTYDFAYLPSVFGKGFEASGLGYAFVNFTDQDAMIKFASTWQGSRRFGLSKTDSAITVAPAEHQGKEINVEKWLRKGCRVRNPELRPFVRLSEPGVEDDHQNFFERLVASMPGLRSSLPEISGPTHGNDSRGVERAIPNESNAEESPTSNGVLPPPGLIAIDAEANAAA